MTPDAARANSEAASAVPRLLRGSLRVAASLSLASLVVCAVGVSAQDDPDPLAASPSEVDIDSFDAAESDAALQDGGDVEMITVRGQRTGSDAQSEAIAISSFNQSALDQLGVSRVADLQGNVPSLHISTSGSSTIVTIRGVGIENTNLSGEPGVLLMVDGIPIGDVTAIDGAFFDVSNVEVLRGPQGTQGGRNAAGGWIEVNSAPPVEDFLAHLDHQFLPVRPHHSPRASEGSTLHAASPTAVPPHILLDLLLGAVEPPAPPPIQPFHPLLEIFQA